MAAVQADAVGGELVGQPGQCGERMAQHVATHAAPALLAVDGHGSRQGGEVEPAPVRCGGSEHDAGLEEVVGDEGRRVERTPVHVAVVHDLDRRHARPDGFRHPIPGKRRRRGRQVGGQAHGDLALDAGVDVAVITDLGGGGVHPAGQHPAAARVVNVQIVLHDPAGGADLVARQGPAAAPNQGLAQRKLHGIRRVFASGTAGVRQRRQPSALESVARQQVGGLPGVCCHVGLLRCRVRASFTPPLPTNDVSCRVECIPAP